MKSSEVAADRPTLAELVATVKFRDDTVSLSARVARLSADDHVGMMKLLEDTVREFGLDAAVLLSCLRDEDSIYSLRTLYACNPNWLVDYADQGWIEHDPWLAYASRSVKAIRSSELLLRTPEAHRFIEHARPYGFNSCLIAPAATALGSARYGVLVLGSAREGYFDDPAYFQFRGVARLLAMELHDWLLDFVRRDLLRKSNLTPPEIALLHEESLGHGSKQIGQQLGVDPRTIDCRFQRVLRKLKADNRAKAMRIAALYGLFD